MALPSAKKGLRSRAFGLIPESEQKRIRKILKREQEQKRKKEIKPGPKGPAIERRRGRKVV